MPAAGQLGPNLVLGYITKELEEGRPVNSKTVYPWNFGWTVNFDTNC